MNEKISKEMEDMMLPEDVKQLKQNKEEQKKGEEKVRGMELDEGEKKEEEPMRDVKDMSLGMDKKSEEEIKKEAEDKKVEEGKKQKAEAEKAKATLALGLVARLEKAFPDADEIDLGQDFKIRKGADGTFSLEDKASGTLKTEDLDRVEAFLKYKEAEKPGETQAEELVARIEKILPKESYVYITAEDVLCRKDDGSFSLSGTSLAELTQEQSTKLEDFLKAKEEETKE